MKVTQKTLVILALLLMPVISLWGQTKDIGGKVKDAKDDSVLPGVTVLIKGTSTGTMTDGEGKYSLTVGEGAVLSFTSIGYQAKEVAVGEKQVIDIALVEDTKLLDEVVVVGFGTQKKINLTGSVGVVDAKNFEARPVSTVAQALQGVVPGLNVTTTGGSYETRAKINIRGTGTIGDGSRDSPLILIDGVEGDIHSLNPQDIENISVLKDAAASSIYGSRAPYGVILITTKSGKTGKVNVNYNNSFRDSKPITFPKMMDSYTFALYMNDGTRNGGGTDFFVEDHLQRIKDYQSGKLKDVSFNDPNNPGYWADFYLNGNANVDWYKEMFKKSSFSHEHALSVDGGTEAFNYYISANYLGQDGLLRIGKEGFDRYALAGKFNINLNKYITIGYNTRFTREDFHRPMAMNNTFYTDLARQGWPTMSPYDPNGNLYSAPSQALDFGKGGQHKIQKDITYQQLSATLKPMKGWLIQGDFNFRTTNQFTNYHKLITYNHDVNNNPYVMNKESYVLERGQKDNFINFNVYSSYDFSIAKNNIKVMLGSQSEKYKERVFDARRNGLLDPDRPSLNLTSGTDYDGKGISPSISGRYGNWAALGFFGRLNYNYDQRYLFEANIRYDGSSRFRRDKRWTWSPSFSAGWNISQESFFKPVREYVDVLKVRASYGTLSNQNTTSNYPTYMEMPVGVSNSSWLVDGKKINTANIPGLVSYAMTWEKVKSWNIGLDFGAFRNRLTGSFDYYKRMTNDMIGPAPELPIILGRRVPKTNNTDLETSGFELQMKWNDVLSNGLGYSLGVSVSDSRTKITRYPNDTKNIWTHRAGAMMGDIWGYETKGIAKTKEVMDAHLATMNNGAQNPLGTNWDAGDIMYVDLNGDGKIDGGAGTIDDHGDVRVIGNNTPRYNFGIDLVVDWKGFDMRAFFQGTMKKEVFQGGYYFWGASNSMWWSTGFKEHKDYFRNDTEHPLGLNLDSYYARPVFSAKNQQTQSRYVQDASYIRLKNLQLGYTLPSPLTKKIHVEKARFFVSGENLWTGTNLSKIFDPELVDQGANGFGNTYPLSRTLSFGLSVNF